LTLANLSRDICQSLDGDLAAAQERNIIAKLVGISVRDRAVYGSLLFSVVEVPFREGELAG
jgi:hypothetical protein